MSDAELRAELARLLGFTADGLLRLALVIAELESRGENLSDLKIGLLPALRKIAAGRLLPEVVVRFAGEPGVLRRVAARPVSEQRLVLDGVLPPVPPRPITAGNMGSGRRQLHKSTPAAGGPDADADDAPLPELPKVNPAGIAARATPRDVGELAADLILNCPERDAAWARLIDRLAERRALDESTVPIVRRAVTRPPRKFTQWADDGD